MKLFKKAAAVALAAVLSLSMLTACGGGSAAAGYRLQKLLKASQDSALYTELEVEGMGTIYLAQGTQAAYLKTESNGNITEHVKKGEQTYKLNATSKKYKEADTEGFDFMGAFLPQEAYLAKIQIVPEYDVGGYKFYAEVIDLGAASKLAYCFNSDKLAYIVLTTTGDGGSTMSLQVKKWESSIPQDVQDKINLTGYTKVDTGADI